jgi:hypothetical protein
MSHKLGLSHSGKVTPERDKIRRGISQNAESQALQRATWKDLKGGGAAGGTVDDRPRARPLFPSGRRNIIDKPRNDDRVSELFLSFEGGDVVEHDFARVGDRQIVEGAGLNAHMRASK